MANGTLGKQLTVATSYVTVYTVPATAEFATVTIYVCNGTVNDAAMRIAISTEATTPLAQDHVEYGAIVPANGGVMDRTCIPLSPGDKVMVWSDRAGVAVRVSGLEQPAA